MKTKNINFKLFIALWNKIQNQTTPQIHFQMADWLESSWTQEQTRLLLQAFRSSGKSTITGLYAAWRLFQHPDLRILVLAAETTLARKMVRNVKRIIERHPCTAHLKPDKLDQWGNERFTVNRSKELRDPSMLAYGISSNMTGSRADIIICDDVEVPNTCDTAGKRETLRDRLSENDFVLVPGGTMLYVGTPHSWYTIYTDTPRQEIGEDDIFLNGYNRLTIPLLNEKNECVWPERYTKSDIKRMRKAAGPNKFASQMLLKPVNIADGHLDPAALQFYSDDLIMSDELKGLYLNGKRLVSSSAWWDPAFGRQGGDRSVLAVIFTDEKGEYYLHHLAYITVPQNSPEDEATNQCKQIINIARRLYLPSITLEINGLGRFLPNILRRELNSARVPCAVRETSSTKPKDLRILESFDAVMAARALHVHSDIQKTPFITEMQEWRPGKNNTHDDGLDAVAGALSLEPIRIKRGTVTNKPGHSHWSNSSQTHTAKTDFKI